MNKFFFLQLLDREDAPVAYGEDDPWRDEMLAMPERVSGWLGLRLAVRGGEPTDYLANNVGVRLCSARLRTILDEQRGTEDEFEWLGANVVDEAGKEHDYAVLHFISGADVLDPERTIRAGAEFVVKPVVSPERASNHRVFSFMGATTRFIVRDEVKRVIQQAGCTGVDFEAVPMS